MTQATVIWEEGLSMNVPTEDWYVDKSQYIILINDCDATPKLLVLHAIRKQAEQFIRDSKTISTFLHASGSGPSLSSCLDFCSM